MKLNNYGFSLVETLTVMMLFSIIIVGFIPLMLNVKAKSNSLSGEQQCLNIYLSIDKVLDDLYVEQYPYLLIDNDVIHIKNYKYDIEIAINDNLKINNQVIDAIIKEISFEQHFICLTVEIKTKIFNFILEGVEDEIHYN